MNCEKQKNMIKFIKPQLGEVYQYMVTINGISILVVTNVEDILCSVVHAENYMVTEKNKFDFEVPTISIFLNSSIDSNYTVHSSGRKNDKSVYSDDDVLYPNQHYCFGNQNIIFNYYPNNSIIFFDSDNKNQIIVASIKDVLILYLKMYLKKIVLISTRNSFALHASSVGTEIGGFVFLGQGNAGKSTLAFNLSQHGWKILNDDLVFLSDSFGLINIQGIEINPCVRGEAISYIEDSSSLLCNDRCIYNKYHDCYYLTSINTLKFNIPLKAIFILQKDFNNPQLLSNISDYEIKKDLLKKFKRNQSDIEDKMLLKLCEIPMYQLNITCPVSQIDAYLKSIE